MEGRWPGPRGGTWSNGWRSSAPGQHLLRGPLRSTWRPSPSAGAKRLRVQVRLGSATASRDNEGSYVSCELLKGMILCSCTLLGWVTPFAHYQVTYLFTKQMQHDELERHLKLRCLSCTISRFAVCPGKAAKFLGKLGRRVARTPKYGGGGTADAAPTPLIHDSYGGTPGCAELTAADKSALCA